VGAPKHAEYALAAGVDIVCAQGSEGGGHTGSIPTSLLIPAGDISRETNLFETCRKVHYPILSVVDICAGKVSPFTGLPVAVVAAGGIYDGRGLAMSLCYGAQAKLPTPNRLPTETSINFLPSRLFGSELVSSAQPKQALRRATSKPC
jgi:NAD(P)H-dependent flavin oxidoreductase YrpB (nitropropane dioxygenase family)